MLATAHTAAVTQVSRHMSECAQFSDLTVRELALEGWRQRNTLLDALFYDVGQISTDEAKTISPWLAKEGSILIVPPSGKGSLHPCANIEEAVTYGADTIDILTVAGVGSSALGAAAYARNVANAVDSTVLSVVSGYGLADLLTEALGGYFLFGHLNSVRASFERLDSSVHDVVTGTGETSAEVVRKSLDTVTVAALLRDPRFSFRMLTGHSKGNLVISEALYALRDIDPGHLADIGKTVDIVTVCAKITMPPECQRIVDVTGAWDWFGALNSRWWLETEMRVPKAWHHTNTEIPAHLPVTRTFRELAAAGRILA